MRIGGIRVAKLIRINNQINIRHGSSSSSTRIYIVRLIGKYYKKNSNGKFLANLTNLFEIAVCYLLSCSWIALIRPTFSVNDKSMRRLIWKFDSSMRGRTS